MARFLLSKNVQIAGYILFASIISCKEESNIKFHYSPTEIHAYLADLLIKEAAVKMMPRIYLDSMTKVLEMAIIENHQLDSQRIAEDVARINGSAELSMEYFQAVQDTLEKKLK